MRLFMLAAASAVGAAVDCGDAWRPPHIVGRDPDDGASCKFVYFDFGGNIGVQTRKLFEPHLYPARGRKSFFDVWARVFGEDREAWRKDVCVVGFEPNPAHAPRLRELAERYTARGWRTTYVLAGIGDADAVTRFRARPNDIQAAAAFLGGCDPRSTPVPVVDIATALRTYGRGAAGVVAKVDIEGYEYRTLARVRAEGLECAADAWVVEFQGAGPHQSDIAAWRAATGDATCTTSLELDEESYMIDPRPLPPKLGADASADDPWATLNMKDHGGFWLHDMQPRPPAPSKVAAPVPALPTPPLPPPPPNCALLFFGLPKHFADVVLPSIRSEILAHNPGCDVFAHTYNVTAVTTARNGEDHAAIHVDEVFSLTRDVVVDAPDALPHDLARYRAYKPADWPSHQQMDNMIKQWHSIERAWGAMVEGERRRGRRYERVGLFRLDVKYVTPVRLGDGAVAAVPNFGHWFNDPAKGLNDRAFYGGRAYAEHWATARFPQADAYAAAHGNKLHSESFMLWLLRDVPVELKPICFLRVRATGRVMQGDCDGGHTGYGPMSPLPQRRSQI